MTKLSRKLAWVAVVLGIVSCGGVDEKKLDGTWLAISDATYVNGKPLRYPTLINETGEIVQFRDGRLKIVKGGNFFSEHGPVVRDTKGVKVKLDGGRLVFGDVPEDDTNDSIEVTSLDDKHLEVRWTHPNVAGVSSEDRAIYKRITEDRMNEIMEGKGGHAAEPPVPGR